MEKSQRNTIDPWGSGTRAFSINDQFMSSWVRKMIEFAAQKVEGCRVCWISARVSQTCLLPSPTESMVEGIWEISSISEINSYLEWLAKRCDQLPIYHVLIGAHWEGHPPKLPKKRKESSALTYFTTIHYLLQKTPRFYSLSLLFFWLTHSNLFPWLNLHDFSQIHNSLGCTLQIAEHPKLLPSKGWASENKATYPNHHPFYWDVSI